MPNQPQNVTLFGHDFTVACERQLNKLILDALTVSTDEPFILAHHNLHSVALSRNNRAMQNYFDQARYVWLDGMPVVFMLRLLGYPIDKYWRLTFLDWHASFWPLIHNSGHSVFLLGGKPGVLDKVSAKLVQKHSGLSISTHHGYFSSGDQNVIKLINKSNADVLLVGLGMPLQEEWIFENRSKLNSRVIMPVGGYFDYLAGGTYTPPRWSGKLGLEWIFRLFADPVRLWKRYLLEPLPVLVDFAKDFAQRKWRD